MDDSLKAFGFQYEDMPNRKWDKLRKQFKRGIHNGKNAK